MGLAGVVSDAASLLCLPTCCCMLTAASSACIAHRKLTNATSIASIEYSNHRGMFGSRPCCRCEGVMLSLDRARALCSHIVYTLAFLCMCAGMLPAVWCPPQATLS